MSRARNTHKRFWSERKKQLGTPEHRYSSVKTGLTNRRLRKHCGMRQSRDLVARSCEPGNKPLRSMQETSSLISNMRSSLLDTADCLKPNGNPTVN